MMRLSAVETAGLRRGGYRRRGKGLAEVGLCGEVEDGARQHHVVPLPVEVLTDDREGAHLLVRDLYALLVDRAVDPGPHLEAGSRRGGGDEVAHDLEGGERLAAPVLGDLAEEPALDLVELGVAGVKWCTSTMMPFLSANCWSISLNRRHLAPFEPPPSQVTRRARAPG